MKIGRIGLGPSRRDVRRAKEEAAARTPAPEGNHWREVRPKVLKQGERPYREILLPPDDVLDKHRGAKEGLPPQKALLRKCLQLMHQVELTMGDQVWGEAGRVRHSIIQDMDGKGRLYLAQTSPPMMASQKGKMARLTFLDRYYDIPGGRWLRVGYTTPIREVIRGYRLSDSLSEDVIVVDGPRRLERVTERSAYRLVPPDDLDLRLELRPEGTKVGLMDISASGARFYHHRTWHFAKGKTVPLWLLSGELTMRLVGRVVRNEKIRDRWGIEHGVTCVNFEWTDNQVRQDFLRLLTEIYRYLLAQRSGIKEKGRA